MGPWLILTLWDDSPVLIPVDMIVDIIPQHDLDKTWVQTVRDTWPVKQSIDQIQTVLIKAGALFFEVPGQKQLFPKGKRS